MSALYALEVIHNDEWIYKKTVTIETYETIEQVSQMYKRIIAHSRMVDENEIKVNIYPYKK